MIGWEFERRMDICICMVESLRCSPETIMTLLIGYTPKQNKKLKKKSGHHQHLILFCPVKLESMVESMCNSV